MASAVSIVEQLTTHILHPTSYILHLTSSISHLMTLQKYNHPIAIYEFFCLFFIRSCCFVLQPLKHNMLYIKNKHTHPQVLSEKDTPECQSVKVSNSFSNVKLVTII